MTFHSDDGVVAISGCLMNNSTLQELNMSHNKISNNGISNIGKVLQINTTLEILDVSHNNISDEGAIAIGEALSNMVITNEGVTNEDNVQNCALQKLNLSYNIISSEGIVALSGFLKNNNTLEELTISWNSQRPLVFNRTIEFCNFFNKHFGDVGTILISAFLFQNDRMLKLELSYNYISDDGARAISECLKVSKTLKELNISNNMITSLGIIKITEAIQINTTLRLLDILHNNISRCIEVVRVLSDHLRHNNTLQVLGISCNDSDTTYVYAVGINSECYVGDTWPRSEWNNNTVHYVQERHYIQLHHWPNDEGLQLQIFDSIEAIILTALLCNNAEISKLKIVRSELSENAVVFISDFLKVNKTLQEFELSKSKTSIKQIIKAIRANATLQILNISYNIISDTGIVTINECLKHNNTLKVINISGNYITEREAKTMTNFIPENTTYIFAIIMYQMMQQWPLVSILC